VRHFSQMLLGILQLSMMCCLGRHMAGPLNALVMTVPATLCWRASARTNCELHAAPHLRVLADGFCRRHQVGQHLQLGRQHCCVEGCIPCLHDRRCAGVRGYHRQEGVVTRKAWQAVSMWVRAVSAARQLMGCSSSSAVLQMGGHNVSTLHCAHGSQWDRRRPPPAA
jgi:hypothetical protein